MNEILKLLNDDKIYRDTLRKLLKNMDLVDVYATYDDKSRKEYVKKQQFIIDYYDGDVDTVDLFEKGDVLLNYDMNIGEMHRNSGTRMDYLLAAMKNMMRCHEKMLMDSAIDKQHVAKFIVNSRKIQDVRETLVVKNWYIATMSEVKHHHQELFAQMRQLHRRHQKIINTIAYPVVVMDSKGKVLEMNSAAQNYFAVWNFESNLEIVSLLDFHFSTFNEFLASYKDKPVRQLGFTNGDQFFSELTQVDKTSYMLTLKSLQAEEGEEKGVNAYDTLTYTENIVCEYIKQGVSTKQIADKLGLSEETVKTHRKSIRRKLGIVNHKITIPRHTSHK